MPYSPEQLDRAIAVLLGAAVGDALGAGYEFETAPFTGKAEMIGGGLGDFAPYEWTDDTAQTYCVAQAAAEFHDLRTEPALDAIAAGFIRWFRSSPPDVGIQTRAVLKAALNEKELNRKETPTARQLTEAARQYSNQHRRSAGNGSLMRTSPVALAHLGDAHALVEAAYAVSELTHGDPLAAEACAIWCLLIREAVLLGGIPDPLQLLGYLPTTMAQDRWALHFAEADENPPGTFTPNGYVVTAVQAAWSAFRHTPIPPSDPKQHLVDSLNTAIGIGNDTDTVASIAGALLGARWGTAAIPPEWRDKVHGWGNTPNQTATGADLAVLASRILKTG
ncbi:MAG: ADP-ribosylglycohydrolase family protein [Promicromonosporaceae bacterium]|nr:ADP-ribosylglycohydrolase family protein [Promicromonosporaceae bacterium]